MFPATNKMTRFLRIFEHFQVINFPNNKIVGSCFCGFRNLTHNANLSYIQHGCKAIVVAGSCAVLLTSIWPLDLLSWVQRT
jgi:hypothetical protein